MAPILVSVGAGIFVLLGIGHAVFTLQSTPEGGPMMPTNAATRQAMNVPGGLGLAPELQSSLYKAWIGFNHSHALGVVVASAIVLYHALQDLSAAAGQVWFVVLALAVPLIYLLLAQLYWFSKPRDAIALGTVLIWAGMVIELA